MGGGGGDVLLAVVVVGLAVVGVVLLNKATFYCIYYPYFNFIN